MGLESPTNNFDVGLICELWFEMGVWMITLVKVPSRYSKASLQS